MIYRLWQELKEGWADIIGLIYPHTCAGCGQNLVKGEQEICLACLLEIPQTNFHRDSQNLVWQLFRGRVSIAMAASYVYFDKGGKVQSILHSIKYKGNQNLARQLGMLYGHILKQDHALEEVDYFIPIPLHPLKLKQRGYNQSEVWGEGLASSTGIYLLNNNLYRTENTASQTRKSRIGRWENVKDIFALKRPEEIQGKNVVLLDDVVTTGSTLESAAQCLLDSGASKVGILTLACAVKI
ncbi:MAG: ComF family protein [Flavobacteriales bacterium]|nr:ComF family protein [Flavobacteriales bacterium]